MTRMLLLALVAYPLPQRDAAWLRPELRRPQGLVFGDSRFPIGYLENKTALRASSTDSTIGTMIPSAPASQAFRMSPMFAEGTRTNGMHHASAITLISCCVSRQVNVLCCISIQMKSCPTQAFFAASRSGLETVLLKTCLPALSFGITVLKVSEPGSATGPFCSLGGCAWAGCCVSATEAVSAPAMQAASLTRCRADPLRGFGVRGEIVLLITCPPVRIGPPRRPYGVLSPSSTRAWLSRRSSA